ncbi:MAG TPA: carboxylating nicotinate-nucleotide diphosphorylase [Candidatus Polarisedimenticolaceae bacterium]|nr:carboxylating nicotinate-nucleotide diphosphorylase [Candidatus Polarisedimenticolaceae bacterium]
MRLERELLIPIVERALEEDLGRAGDLTGDAVVPVAARGEAVIVARQSLILAGIPLAREVYRAIDPELRFSAAHEDGSRVDRDTVVARVAGSTRALVRGERTALNFLMRMSGIATATRAAVDEIDGTSARILDTRKTAPGLRLLDKYAVRCGGGLNHRMGLYDAVLIKDTHLGAGCTVGQAVRRALDAGHPAAIVTAEVRGLDQLEQAIEAGVGRVLLDNMPLEMMAEAVRRAERRVVIEASGGLRPGHLRSVAETGVDFLSLGWLTHSAPAADLAMEIREPR